MQGYEFTNHGPFLCLVVLLFTTIISVWDASDIDRWVIECQYFVTRDENAQFTLLFGIYLKAKSILFPESEV